MEGISAPTSVTKIQETEVFLREVFDSPKKSTIFLLAVSIVFSVILFVIFLSGQNLAADNLLKQEAKAKLAAAEKTAQENSENSLKNLKSQDSTRKQDLATIKSGLEAFYQNKGFYPSSLINMTPKYLSKVPQDPETGAEYYYLCQLDQRGYILRVQLSTGLEIELTNN
jgi:hypothetical protein